MNWSLQELLWVVFSTPGTARDPASAFSALFGVPAQTLNPHPQGGAVAGGQVGVHRFQLKIQPGRLEISVGPSGPPDSASPPVIENVESAWSESIRFVKAAALAQPTTRVAVVPTLVQPVPSAAAAAARFCELTKLSSIPPDALDLNFQINRRKVFESQPTSQMNRLCTWGVGVGQFIQMQMAVGSGSPSPFTISESYFATLKIDVNNHPTTGTLLDAPAIIDEIAKEARALMLEGYDRIVR